MVMGIDGYLLSPITVFDIDVVLSSQLRILYRFSELDEL